MPVLKNIGFLATCRDKGDQGEVHPIRNAAVAWEERQIAWVGEEADLPERFADHTSFDADGKLVVPGLVDCHTHLVFGGWRSDEYSRRLKGESYLQIARSGGGILSTVRATRAAGEEELFEKASGFLDGMLKLGITTVECKSGYGLSLEDELKTLRVYQKLDTEKHQQVVSTFLGAHTIPPEFKDNREGYIRLIIDEMIPAVAADNLADFCDVFVEDTAFTVDEARRILVTGQAAGMVPKVHADQLTSCGGAELAAEVEAASADHLEQITDEGISAMSEAGVVGVHLPLAALYTQEAPLRCRKLIDGGVAVAVATDFNPGSAPSYDLPLAMMLACNLGGLTPAEALKGATLNAARAIRRDMHTGSIEVGKRADLAVIDAPDPDFWLYHYRPDSCMQTFVEGERVFGISP